MILRILSLALAIFISPALAKMDLGTFTLKFEDMCFQNEQTDPFRVNGQETPLSNTLENFIAMAEKFEAANPMLNLKDELVYFISEYLFENIKFINGQVDLWRLGRANLKVIESLWEPDNNGYMQSFEDPFSNEEKCSLYYMISHSIVEKDEQFLKNYSPGNFSFNRAVTGNLNPAEFYPQEIGVVAIRGTDAAVSLSKVLLGLYVGLKPNRKSELTSYDNVQKLQIQEDKLPQDTEVDALYAVTLADILIQAKWTGSDRPGLAPNADWTSISLADDKPIQGFCPMVYHHKKITGTTLPAYSYSSVRGAADGLILGLTALEIYNKKQNVKLSQILRMYYSPDGLSVEMPTEEINTLNNKKISFCDRKSLILSQTLQRKLQDQMLSYGYLIAQSAKDVERAFTEANTLYNREREVIFDNSHSEIRDYCDRPTSLEKPEDLPRETLLDVVVVMDSSNSENSFQEQQLITGYLAKYLDLWSSGSRMTILVDQKVSSGAGTSSKVELMSIVSDTPSPSCAACIVGQIVYEPSTVERDQVIVGIDHFLQERKDNETKYSGINGKVVVFFNYESDDGRNGNNRVQGQVEKALREFHLRHQDVTFYAVGLNSELLKKYARNDPSLVFLGTDGTQEDVAKRLYSKISFAPALLQYADCEEARSEKGATFENFVSPNTIQHYEMPAEYFYKSRSLTFTFVSQNGYVRVCHNRATTRPENEIKNCKNTTGNAPIEFKLSNPCKSFTKETCAPFYFSVMGMDSNSAAMRTDNTIRNYCEDLKDKWCKNLDQVKFIVSHTGVRCSGCIGLNAPPAIILLTILMTFFVHKRY